MQAPVHYTVLLIFFWILNSRLPASKQFKFFPDSKFGDQIEYERLLQDSIRATADEVISSKNALQAFVKAHLRTPEEYRRLEEIDRARYYGRKRVLTGTVQTNGHDLKALVLDVTQ
ncbi:hypothetical protein F5H01DRAFT_363591 [Linnemannia elongata]|nr:hypothetical protein F5H01DRAFT_363591 [Linnemannia elongata]